MNGISEIATRAGVHSCNEHKVSGVGSFTFGTREGNLAILEGLAEGLENATRKFGNFVEEENTEVGKRDFAGSQAFAATKHSGKAGGVMG